MMNEIDANTNILAQAKLNSLAGRNDDCSKSNTAASIERHDTNDTLMNDTEIGTTSSIEEEIDGWISSSNFFIQQLRPQKVVQSLTSTIRHTTTNVVQFVQQSAISIVNEMNALDDEINNENDDDNDDDSLEDDDDDVVTAPTTIATNQESIVLLNDHIIVDEYSTMVANDKTSMNNCIDSNDHNNNENDSYLSSSFVYVSNGDDVTTNWTQSINRSNIPRAPYSSTSIKSTDSMVFVDAVVERDDETRQ